VVEDSREGWARALREVIALLYTGHVSGGEGGGGGRVGVGGGVQGLAGKGTQVLYSCSSGLLRHCVCLNG
jgi:hypothetical protein